MELHTKVMAGFVTVLVAFCAGRYSASMKPAVKSVEVVKASIKKDVHTNTHTVIQETKTPQGDIKITKTIDTVQQDVDITHVDTKQSQEIIPPKPINFNVSGLVGTDVTRSGLIPVYGISFNKPFLGPVTLGAFGFSNGLVGVSIGLNF